MIEQKPYPTLGVIIPAYNAGEIIEDIVLQLKRYVPSRYILVVDDGSLDYTLERVRALDVLTFSHQNNRGKGAALETGFSYLEQFRLDYYLTLDADGQHDPENLPDLFRRLEEGFDMVVGDRLHHPDEMPWLRRLSNRLSSLLVSLLIRQRIADSQCGYRLIRREVIDRVRLTSRQFEYETEMLLKVARAGYRIGFVPVHSRYFSEWSQIRKLRDTFRFLFLLFRSLFWTRKRIYRHEH